MTGTTTKKSAVKETAVKAEKAVAVKEKKAKVEKKEGVNPMKKLSLDKVTVNICAGNSKEGMIKAEKLLLKLTNKKPVKTLARRRLAAWQIRPGLPIGYKVTLRNEDAFKFLKWVLDSKDGKFKVSSIDKNGNFSVGFHEYLDLDGIKYDSEIGMMGFEVMATFAKPGYRIKSRRMYPARVPMRHRVTKEEVVEFLSSNLGVKAE